MKSTRFLLILLLAALAALNVFGSSSDYPFTVKVSGKGRPMILIPGHSCSGEVWEDTVARYQDRFECHVLTLAGFAGVPAREGALVAPVAEGLGRYIREKHLSKPVILGHSLGGYVALDLGSREPDLVGTLVIVDSYPFFAGVQRPGITPEQARGFGAMMKTQMDSIPDEAYRRNIASGVFTRGMVSDEKRHERIVAWGLATDRHTASTAYAELLSGDLRGELSKIKSPVLVLGSWIGFKAYTDHARTEATLRDQYSALTGVRVEVSDTANHFIMYDDAAWMYAQIEKVL